MSSMVEHKCLGQFHADISQVWASINYWGCLALWKSRHPLYLRWGAPRSARLVDCKSGLLLSLLGSWGKPRGWRSALKYSESSPGWFFGLSHFPEQTFTSSVWLEVWVCVVGQLQNLGPFTQVVVEMFVPGPQFPNHNSIYPHLCSTRIYRTVSL